MNARQSPQPNVGGNPLDSYASAGSRFLIELTAWVAGPWAAYDLTDSWLMAAAALAVLFLLPAVFNVDGDKHIGGVQVPGIVRLAIEMLLLVVALVAAAIVWPTWAVVIVAVIGVLMVATGLPRYRWMLGQ